MYYPYSYGINTNYLIYAVIPMMICMWAQYKVKSAYKKYSRIRVSGNVTGAEAARRMLDAHGLHDIQIQEVRGTLSDHYDPVHRVLSLSKDVYEVPSIAAVSVACHEAGHAYQHADKYFPLSIRTALVPVVNLGAKAGPLLIMIGFFAMSLLGSQFGTSIMKIGFFGFILTTLFSLITLPVEFNATNRGKEWLSRSGIIAESEQDSVSEMLSAAAMTYVSATIQSIATMLYYASMLGIGNDRDNRRR